jgi:uncharacterized membrane protein YqiK
MDIQQLRGWADVADKALMVSVIVALLAVLAVGVSAFFSVRFAGALRSQENEVFDRFRSQWSRHADQLQEGAAQATARIAELERAVADADQRAVRAGTESASAQERAAVLEREAVEARQRVAALEKRAEEQGALPPQVGKAEAAAAPATEPESKPAEGNRQKSKVAESLAKHAGSQAAIYVIEEAPDATDAGDSINVILGDAGWTSATWRWSGVGGILGVVVLVRSGSEPAVDEAASGLVDALRSDGFNAAKANWPADWKRFRGTLSHGPLTPAPTDAPIRIVVGSRAR